MTISDPDINDSNHCPRCGQPNACGFNQSTSCWCALPELDRLQPVAQVSCCYCRTCLEQMLREQRGIAT